MEGEGLICWEMIVVGTAGRFILVPTNEEETDKSKNTNRHTDRHTATDTQTDRQTDRQVVAGVVVRRL